MSRSKKDRRKVHESNGGKLKGKIQREGKHVAKKDLGGGGTGAERGGKEGTYPLRHGGIAYPAGELEWSFGHACIEQLERLGVKISHDAESFLRRCFDYLVDDLGEENLCASLGVGEDTLPQTDKSEIAAVARMKVLEARAAMMDRESKDRTVDKSIMHLVVEIAAPALLGRPVVVYTGGEANNEDQVLLRDGHSAQKVFRHQYGDGKATHNVPDALEIASSIRVIDTLDSVAKEGGDNHTMEAAILLHYNEETFFRSVFPSHLPCALSRRETLQDTTSSATTASSKTQDTIATKSRLLDSERKRNLFVAMIMTMLIIVYRCRCRVKT